MKRLLTLALLLFPGAAWAQCSTSSLGTCPSPPFNAITAATLGVSGTATFGTAPSGAGITALLSGYAPLASPTFTGTATIGGVLGTTQSYLTLQGGAAGTLLTQAGQGGYLAQFLGSTNNTNYLKFETGTTANTPINIVASGGANAGIVFQTSGTGLVQVNPELYLLGLSPLSQSALSINSNNGSGTTLSGASMPSVFAENTNIGGTSGTNDVQVNSFNFLDSINAGSAPNGTFNVVINQTLNTGHVGGAAALTAELSTGGALSGTGCCFATANFWSFANNNAGGTTTTGTTAVGAMFAINPQVVLNPGATYWQQANPQENDIAVVATTQTATIGGTFTAGDTVNLTFTSANLTGSPVTVTATVGTGNVANNVCNTLQAAIDGNANLLPAGVSAVCPAASAVLTVNWPLQDSVTLSKSVTGSGTETVTLGSVVMGASAASKEGMTIVRLSSDGAAGANNGDTAIAIGAQNAPMSGAFQYGLTVASDSITATGEILAARPWIAIGGTNKSGFIPPLSTLGGIDLSLDAFARQSGYSLNLPAATLNGNGVLSLGSNLLTPSSSGLSISTAGYVGTTITIANGGGGGAGSTQYAHYVGDEVYDAYGGQYTVTGVNTSTGAITSLHTDNAPTVTGSSPGSGPFSLLYGSGAYATINITWTAATTLALNPNGGVVKIGSGGLSANGTAGVTCTGTPTSSYATVGGIVTHC